MVYSFYSKERYCISLSFLRCFFISTTKKCYPPYRWSAAVKSSSAIFHYLLLVYFHCWRMQVFVNPNEHELRLPTKWKQNFISFEFHQPPPPHLPLVLKCIHRCRLNYALYFNFFQKQHSRIAKVFMIISGYSSSTVVWVDEYVRMFNKFVNLTEIKHRTKKKCGYVVVCRSILITRRRHKKIALLENSICPKRHLQ